MQVVAAVECRLQLAGCGWIAHGGVKIRHAVEQGRAADPLVERLPVFFVVRLRVVQAAVAIGCQRPRDHAHTLRMGAPHQLLPGRLQVVQHGRARLRRLAAAAMQAPQVIHADQDHAVGDAGAPDYVAVETRRDRRSDLVAQHAVAADAGVDHRGRRMGQRESYLQRVGPAVVAVCGRAGAVGDRIADGDEHRRLCRGQHFDPAQLEPRCHLARRAEIPRGRLVSTADELGGVCSRVNALLGRRRFQIKRNGHVRVRSRLHWQRVADDLLARRDRDPGRAAKAQGQYGAADSRTASRTWRDRRRANHQRLAAIQIAEPDSQFTSADR
ncbi:hypothetical protein GCM10027321_04250 [Massilia terrae]